MGGCGLLVCFWMCWWWLYGVIGMFERIKEFDLVD